GGAGVPAPAPEPGVPGRDRRAGAFAGDEGAAVDLPGGMAPFGSGCAATRHGPIRRPPCTRVSMRRFSWILCALLVVSSCQGEEDAAEIESVRVSGNAEHTMTDPVADTSAMRPILTAE